MTLGPIEKYNAIDKFKTNTHIASTLLLIPLMRYFKWHLPIWTPKDSLKNILPIYSFTSPRGQRFTGVDKYISSRSIYLGLFMSCKHPLCFVLIPITSRTNIHIGEIFSRDCTWYHPWHNTVHTLHTLGLHILLLWRVEVSNNQVATWPLDHIPE